jgi:hypothetical protein
MRLMVLALLATFGLMQPTLAESPYQWALDSFSFPKDRCGEPLRIEAGITGADMNARQKINEEWRQCQTSLQDSDKRALRMLVTGKLDGQWQTRGSNFAWAVADDCDCRSDVKSLIDEMGARERKRQRANDELMADSAAAMSLQGLKR